VPFGLTASGEIAETDGYDPTIIFAIEQGTAERGAVAPRSGSILHGRAL
jgi:hypothetical protein